MTEGNEWSRKVVLITLGLMVFPSSMLLQGCLPALWVGIVGVDTMRSSAVELEPFEHSWVAPHETWQQHGAVASIAVVPFWGDPFMAARLAAVLQQATTLHVVRPAQFTTYTSLDVRTSLTESVTLQDEIGLAQRISADFAVNCVLFGRVVGGQPQRSFWGWKERRPKRLYLYLISAQGTLLWKDELPFTVVKGKKELEEEWVKKALMTQLLAHANELGMTEFTLGGKATRS